MVIGYAYELVQTFKYSRHTERRENLIKCKQDVFIIELNWCRINKKNCIDFPSVVFKFQKKIVTINRKASKHKEKKIVGKWFALIRIQVCVRSYLSLTKAIWQSKWKFDYFHNIYSHSKMSEPLDLMPVHHVKRIWKSGKIEHNKRKYVRMYVYNDGNDNEEENGVNLCK